MSGRNLEDFFQDTDAFDALSDEDKARLYAGETLEGETKAGNPAEEISEPPAADAVNPEESKPAAVEPEPVVLAKDGQHTIPFSELEAARERTRQLEQELLALKSQPATQLPAEGGTTEASTEPPAESNEDKLSRLRDELREAMFTANTELAAKLEKECDALNRQIWSDDQDAKDAARKAAEAREQANRDIQSRASALIEKYPFLDHTDPSKANTKAINLVVAERLRLEAEGMPTAEAMERAVADVAPLFDKNPTQQTDADVARRAAEAISKAKNPVATSLSQAPAGSKPMHDEGEVMRNMDINRLSQSLESKSPEEIMRIMAKAL